MTQELAFLVGFPRSGTSLTGQIIDSHPDAVLAEETPAMDAAISALQRIKGEFPVDLALLTDSDRVTVRTAYFSKLGVRADQSRLVLDKFPLNINYLPLIRWLFPDAPVMIILRHPCDVILSCFMQDFEPNDAMANFYDLDDSVSLYVKVMGFWVDQPAGQLEQRFYYEKLVAEQEQQSREMLDFLGLRWAPEVLEFHARVGDRGRVTTPSYEQIARPMYSESSGRWLAYRKQLAPFAPQLNPLIRALGYDKTL